MVIRALKVAELLEQYSIEAGVIDLFRIKPFPAEDLCHSVADCLQLATLEEHFVTGGLGSAVLEALSEQDLHKRTLRLGIPDKFCRVYGHRDDLLKENLLDIETLVARIIDFSETRLTEL
jgi:transketolase